MFLVSATVKPFRSINQEQVVSIGPGETTLVGMNEAGKTVFLRALEKSSDAKGQATFDPIEDYPRKDLSAYLKRQKESPEVVTALEYRLSDTEVAAINAELHTSLPKGYAFTVEHKYNNQLLITLDADEKPVIAWAAANSQLSTDAKKLLEGAVSLRAALTGVI